MKGLSGVEPLRRALHEAGHPAAGYPIEPMRDKGLAHDHFRLGLHLLARVPKQSQMGLAAAAALAYEAACFERAGPSGIAPVLHGSLPPSAHLPRGALLVARVDGRPARLPAELPAIARSLAALHRLPLPPAAQRAPLQDPTDALQDLVDEVTKQARDGASSAVPVVARHAIDDGLAHLRRMLDSSRRRPQRRLVAFDAHPGNFLVDDPGRAWLVDLEKCRYSHPGLDLAHATLYTSTTWDVDSRTALEPSDVLAFHAAWEAAVDPELAGDARRWHGALRHAMWLWSLTWCARWRVLSSRPPRAGADGEDWSAQRSDPALVAHVRDRVDHYLGREAVERVLDELDVLGRAWAR